MWPFDPHQRGAYDLIMADPPWTFATRSPKGVTSRGAGGQYRTMTMADIAALPVGLLGKRDCLCWLWATNPMLDQQIDVLKGWGFRFKTAGHWAKMTRGGKQAFGTGFIFRCAGEPYVIGTRGKPKTTRAVRSVIFGEAREHSRKPDEAFTAAERLMPGARRIELFSRQVRPGWDSWGDEAGRFAPVPGLFD